MQSIIVIPCYNEEKRLSEKAFAEYADTHKGISFLFVNDGSNDSTLSTLQRLVSQNDRMHLLDLPGNVGKAEAVRRGFLHATTQFNAELIGFWDADLATPLSEIEAMISSMERGGYDIVTGLRLMRLGAQVWRKKTRHYTGRCFATVASMLLDLPVYDTQCGAKLFKSGIVPQLFTEPFITKWLFDVELLARYKKLFGKAQTIKQVYEHPVMAWVDVSGSRLRSHDFVKAPKELWKIWRKYK